MIASTVVVLPVPGGPWINVMGAPSIAARRAACETRKENSSYTSDNQRKIRGFRSTLCAEHADKAERVVDFFLPVDFRWCTSDDAQLWTSHGSKSSADHVPRDALSSPKRWFRYGSDMPKGERRTRPSGAHNSL